MRRYLYSVTSLLSGSFPSLVVVISVFADKLSVSLANALVKLQEITNKEIVIAIVLLIFFIVSPLF